MRVVEKERTVEVDRTLRKALVKLVGDESHLEAARRKRRGKSTPSAHVPGVSALCVERKDLKALLVRFHGVTTSSNTVNSPFLRSRSSCGVVRFR